MADIESRSNATQSGTDTPSDTAAAEQRVSVSDAPSNESSGLSESMEAQIDRAMAALDKPKPAKPAPIRGPRVVQAGREHRKGVVVSVGPNDVFVEFGPKSLGVVPRNQWPDAELPAVRSELEVVVDHFEPGENLFICSRPGLVQKADWEMLEEGQIIEARVTGVNKGGLELEVAQHRAFMPAGQVSFERIEDLSVMIGEKLTCVVQRVDRRGGGNIVLSRRDLLAQERKEKAAKLKESLAEGQVIDGTVRKIMPFGAFVDLGGVDGLVHLGDLSHDRVGHGERAVARYVKEGQQVRVQVLKLDWENNRISLGIKQVQADPFAQATEEVKEGAEVSGRVTKILDFGAFVEIAPGVEGLVHISELAYRRVEKVDDVIKPDEVVRAKVLRIDPDNRRISLSIRATQPPPEPVQPAEGEQGGQSRGGQGKGGFGGGRGGRPGQGGRRGREERGPSYAEIMKETPALRRLREKFGKGGLKGGIG